VCAAIADRFGWSRGKVRALFVISTLLPGPQIVLYIVLWIVIPGED
jgi:phage shock protein C